MPIRWARVVLALGLVVAMVWLLDASQTTWAQPNQARLRQSINTRVPSPTNGPTSTGTPTAEPCVGRVLLQEGMSGYSGTSDTWIYSYLPDFPQTQDGGLKIKGGELQSVLIRFDLQGKVPMGAEVLEAELVLWVDAFTESRSLDVGAFRVLRPWSQGSATWNNASTSTKWAQPGCNGAGQDRVDTADGAVTLAYRSAFRGINVTDSVIHWLEHPTENYGWLLKGISSSTAEYYFSSSRYSQTAYRPVLRIDYNVCGGTPTLPAQTVTPTTTKDPTASVTPVIQPDEIRVLVYRDLNRNRVQDAMEPGLPGARIELWNAAGQFVRSEMTNANGQCTLVGVAPGLYRVRERNPWGYVSTTDDQVAVQVGDGQLFLTFGDYPGYAAALPMILNRR